MLVLDHWKYDGFEQHVEKVSDFYRTKKDQCLAAVEKHMTGIVQVCLNRYLTGDLCCFIRYYPLYSDRFSQADKSNKNGIVLFVF